MDNRETHIPRLRFPAFSGGWEEKKFKDITFPVGKRNRQNLPYERYSISNEVGFYPQHEQFEDGGGYLKDIDCRQYIIVPPKSFAYNPARINVGSIGYQDLGKEVIVSSLYEVFQTKSDCDDSFLWQWFHTDIFHKMVVNVQEGGVRQYFYYEKLKDCVILLPSIAEQRRIAECLDTVDQMIFAQEQKVEALTEKKKGLMQELFPQSDESTPRLRFPGFTGEWEERSLGDVLDYEQPTSYLVSSDSYQTKGTPVLTAGKTFILGYTDESYGIYDKVPVIIFDDFVTESKYVTFPFKAKSSAMKMLSLKNKSESLFFAYTELLLNQKPTGDHKRHWISETSQMTVLYPPTVAEQHKIAEFISALDEIITNEEKIAIALKDYKRGLMQLLFPQPNK